MKFKKLTVLPIAAAVFASGACSSNQSHEEVLDSDITETTQTTDAPRDGARGKVFIPEPELDGPQAPLPPTAHMPTTIECSTRAISGPDEIVSKVISHVTVEKGFDGKTYLSVTPDLYYVDEQAPDFIKEALIPGHGGRVEMSSEVEPFTLGFDRSNLKGLSDFSFMIAFTEDATAMVSTFTGDFSNVTAQSVGQGAQAIGLLTATAAEGTEVSVVDTSHEKHEVKRNVPAGFVRDGRSIRTEILEIDDYSSIDVFDRGNQIGCETSTGAEVVVDGYATPSEPIGRSL